MSTIQAKSKANVNLGKVPGTDHHRTAVTFNCFILKMTEILNNFGNEMEEVLEKADSSLSAADRKLRLMEAKLSMVQVDSEREDVQKMPPVTIPAPSEVVVAPEVPEASEPLEAPEAAPRTVAVTEDPPAASSSQNQNVIFIKDDPAYSKYFKMLKMGVPEAGVIQKMASEGVDPSILKRGDEPSRIEDKKTLESSDDESVSSFSDSD